jgi:viroplasmin and RNaseH domain-containing protein
LEALEGRAGVPNELTRSKPKEVPTLEGTEEWYGMVQGKEGSGVYQSWGTTSALVLGYDNAVFQKFDSFEKAQTFVENFQET